MNKKGFNMNVGIELVLFLILFFILIAYIGMEMNNTYGKSYDLTFGTNLSSQLTSLESFRSSSYNQTQGSASISDFGIFKLATAPGMMMSLFGILWTFFDGSFIYNLVTAMNLGGSYATSVALIFQILYVCALVFLLIKLVLRIVP